MGAAVSGGLLSSLEFMGLINFFTIEIPLVQFAAGTNPIGQYNYVTIESEYATTWIWSALAADLAVVGSAAAGAGIWAYIELNYMKWLAGNKPQTTDPNILKLIGQPPATQLLADIPPLICRWTNDGRCRERGMSTVPSKRTVWIYPRPRKQRTMLSYAKASGVASNRRENIYKMGKTSKRSKISKSSKRLRR